MNRIHNRFQRSHNKRVRDMYKRHHGYRANYFVFMI
ncbi:IdeS/Mac family cysteine endopeptidase [Sutcliffiella horikoshii]